MLNQEVFNQQDFKNANPYMEARIDRQFVSKFAREGVWLGPYYYYLDNNYDAQQDTVKRIHYPTYLVGYQIERLIKLIQSRHIVEVDYVDIDVSFPVSDAMDLDSDSEYVLWDTSIHPVEFCMDVQQTYLSKDTPYNNDPDEPETFLETHSLIEPIEHEEIANELATAPTSIVQAVATGNYYDNYLALMRRYVLPLSRPIAIQAIMTFKRSIVLMNKNPVGLTLLSLEREYFKAVRSIDYTFASSAGSIFFPATDQKRMMLNFGVSHTCEALLCRYMSWPETYRMRLINKAWYGVIKDMLVAQEAIFLCSVRSTEGDEMSCRSSYLLTTERWAVTNRDGSCSNCNTIADCSCLTIDTVMRPDELINIFFFGNQFLLNIMTNVCLENPTLHTETLVCIGVLLSRHYNLPSTLRAQKCASQLPFIFMTQLRFSSQWKKMRIPRKNDTFIMWRGQKYKIKFIKKKYNKKYRNGDYRTNIIGRRKFDYDPY